MKPIILFLVILFPISAVAENAVILKQQNTPLEITFYKAKFEEESRGNYSSNPDQILHELTYKNIGNKNIVAICIGLAAFDIFNDFMGRFGGVSIKDLEINKETSGAWTQRPYATFLFKKYGTGVAYVAEIRFEDNTFWEADLEDVLKQMQKFEKDLEKDDLKEKRN